MGNRFKLTYPEHFVVVVGKPLVNLEQIGLDCCLHNTLYTEERFLPKILVEIGIFPSISEVRRNRKELIVELNKIDWLTLKLGYRVVDIIVGER